MMPWFVWKGKNSLADYGLWVTKLPDHTRAEERHEEVEVPGRAGSLIMLEGDDVYASYTAEIIVTARNDLPIDRICDWLRGSGELIISTETDRVRDARIVGPVSFSRVGNNLQQAVIPFVCQPFSRSRYPQHTDRLVITDTTLHSFHNIGDVASRPIVTISGNGNNTIVISGMQMTFSAISGTIVVDCGAEIITQGGEIWNGTVSGEYWKIPTGRVSVSQRESMTVVIDPEWRWF